MILAFNEFELDSDLAELRHDGAAVSIEKQAFDLLLLLAENAHRVVSKDELIEKVWGGRFISDSSISTAVKHARKALGDDGVRQDFIKTIHGRGFRFVAKTAAKAAVKPAETISEPIKTQITVGPADGTPSIAVLPFSVLGVGDIGPAIGDAIPAELIGALSRLRWLFVTARGSSFRFRDPATPPETLRDMLGVRYVLSDTVEVLGDMLTISTELMRTDTGSVVWSDRYASAMAAIHETRMEIIGDVIAALEIHIPYTEASIARSLDPDQIGAWAHFHIGLQHIYRFNRADNVEAEKHFSRALELEPEFARAHAGLSFTNWQNAFMHFGDDRKQLLNAAETSATMANRLDPHDPFANYNMARVNWLKGDIDGFSEWLNRTMAINPNFAQGSYSMGLANLFRGEPDQAKDSCAQAMRLSPLDPLRYAMLCCYGKSLASKGQLDEATDWAEKACTQPGSHYYIDMIAAAIHQMAGSHAQAQMRAQVTREKQPDVTSDMFFAAFPYGKNTDLRREFEASFKTLGL